MNESIGSRTYLECDARQVEWMAERDKQSGHH